MAGEADAAALRGSGLVLVVDDDADVRAVAVGFLTEAGYAVREAGDVAAALRSWKPNRFRWRWWITPCPAIPGWNWCARHASAGPA